MPIARVRLAPGGEHQPGAVDEAAAAITSGRLVVLPTETVYGLAADPQSRASVERAFAFKGRGASHEMTFHLADVAELERLAHAPAPRVQRLLQRYWPGPVTIVLRGRERGTVGLRVPAHDFTRAVIRRVGRPLFLTSV